MRPPRRLIDPARLGVSIASLGLRWSAASRVSTTGVPGRAGTVPGTGAAGPPSFGAAPGIGVWAGCNGLALAVGPTIGGLLVDAAGWRSIFALVVPISVLAMAMAIRTVPESRDAQGRRLDLRGQALVIIALAALSFVTIEGPHEGFASPAILALIAVFIVSSALFLVSQRNRAGALVPLDVFRNAPFDAALAVAGMMTFGMYAMLFLTPLYLQTLGKFSAFAVGLQLLPLSATFVAVSHYSGALAKRFGPRGVMASGERAAADQSEGGGSSLSRKRRIRTRSCWRAL